MPVNNRTVILNSLLGLYISKHMAIIVAVKQNSPTIIINRTKLIQPEKGTGKYL